MMIGKTSDRNTRPRLTIVDSTLREGEQFAGADFTSEDKLEIARALVEFGVDYLEVTSPAASPRSAADLRMLVDAGFPCTIAAHIRCHEEDARVALECGAGALNMVMATSPILRAAGHGKAIPEVVETAERVARAVRNEAPEIELRFSSEDAFRCPLGDLLNVYLPLSETGLFDRFGIADTTGVAGPEQVSEIVALIARTTKGAGRSAIEFHGHNDAGCAVANARAAYLAGASHINTTVLGIGERNGITALEGLIAALYTLDPVATKAAYRLEALGPLAHLVARKVGREVPFNHVLVGETAFSHKAGIHTKAVYNDPRAYEGLVPEDFGLTREIAVGHRLTGWNAVRVRSEASGYRLSVDALKKATECVKTAADGGDLTLQEVDAIIDQVAAKPSGVT